VLSSVVSVFFYLRIVVMMYMTEEAAAPARPRVSFPAMAGLAVAMLATFYLGVLPTRVIEYAVDSVKSIF
jgi:NADH-quinone oxidoreductase subunit N